MNALVVYWAANIVPLFFFCVLVNYACLGAMYAIFPVSVQNVFGPEFGPSIYVWVLLGGFVTSLINLLMTTVVLDYTSMEFMYYLGAGVQVVTLILTWRFEERLDTENLIKVGGLKMPKKVLTPL